MARNILDNGIVPARLVRLDASGFGTNLDATITNAQRLADAVDTLVTGGSGTVTAYSLGNITGSVTIDYNNGGLQYGTLTADATLTLSNPPASGTVGVIEFEITNAGLYTITFPASVVWDSGVPPQFPASGVSRFSLTTRDAGTTWRGSWQRQVETPTSWNVFDASARANTSSAYLPNGALINAAFPRLLKLGDGATNGGIRARTPRTTGRYYWEDKIVNSSGGSTGNVCLVRSNYTISNSALSNDLVFYTPAGGAIYQNALQVSALATATTNDVIGVQVDLEARTIQFFKNGVVINASPYDYGTLMSAGTVCPGLWHDGGSSSEHITSFARNEWVYGPADATFGVWEA